MIPVQGTVFLTCDDPGGDCDVGRISGVTVKLGGSDATPATLKLDPTPAQGTEQSVIDADAVARRAPSRMVRVAVIVMLPEGPGDPENCHEPRSTSEMGAGPA